MSQDNTTDNPSQFATSVEDWQRRLLQLDRRNNLLYFKPGRSAVLIVDQTPDGIVGDLLTSRKGLDFDYAESRSRRPSSDFQPAADQEEDEDHEPYVIPGDLSGDIPTLELQRRLRNLQRRDREWEEEQGLNVLYLALGFLEWIDGDGEPAKSPLLLLPCDLKRASPRDPFTLSQDEDDLTSNATLAVQMEESGIDLPEIEPEGELVSDYLDKIRELISAHPDWVVTDEIYLAIFAYSKLAMWGDLETIKEKGTDHPLVRSLAGAEPSIETDATLSALNSSQDLSGGRLDDVLDVRDQFAILPADYSQLLAINSAKGGNNLVIHGPPGTGKSQTIANMIATFMAEGKSVLFVSEKTAALDVVKDRLDENGLGVFCLDLHSERGKKANVYRQLQESVDDPRTVRRLEFNYAALAERRRQLNRFVRTLHQIQHPLGRTIFQVHGRFATLQDVPHVPIDVKDIADLDQQHLEDILDAANRIRLRAKEFHEHWTSHWRILKIGTPSLELANMIRRDMQIFTSTMDKVRSIVPRLAEELGISIPSTLNDVRNLGTVALHLATGPGIPLVWMKEGVASRLRRIAEREAGLQQTRTGLLEQLIAKFGDPIPDWDYAAIAEKLVSTHEEDRIVEKLMGMQWGQKIIQGQQIASSFQHLRSALVQIKSIGVEVGDFLGLPHTEMWMDVVKRLEILRTLARLGPVPPAWTEVRGTDLIASHVEEARKMAEDLDEKETQLFSALEPGIVVVVGHDMLARYRTSHQSGLRRLLGSSYRSDRRTIRSFRLGGKKTSLSDELRFLEEIIELQRSLNAWHGAEGELTPLLGHRLMGRQTKWEIVQQDISDVEALLAGWPANRQFLIGLLTGQDDAHNANELAQTLEAVRGTIEDLIQACLDSGVQDQLNEGSLSLSNLEDLIQDASFTVVRIEDAVDEPRRSAIEPISELKEFRDLMECGARLKTLEREQSRAGNALQADFGDRFKAFETDWSDILASLGWADEFLGMVGPVKPSTVLLNHAVQPQDSSYYENISQLAADAVREVEGQTAPLLERYDITAGPWDSWEQANFEDVDSWAQELSQDANSAADWLLYADAAADLDRLVGATTTDRIRQETDDSHLVPGILERRTLLSWLDWVYEHEPALAGFTSMEHEDLISKFRELDEQLEISARQEVAKKVFEGYPDMYASGVRAGELADLRGQLSRRRGQWPVRRLIRRIPRLIQALKPCFLMSPLAVSQYLPLSDIASETLDFNVVIFDEASQVFPEDAIPAILRGRQSILAGDQKQLPPTSYFRRSLADDDPDYDDDDDTDDTDANQLVGRESILDVAVGQIGRLFTEEYLNVHYRSLDESLIRFSNHHFYGDRLLTFPSPGFADSWAGVHDVYVPEGRYDAGATRTNRIEAERVVDLVFEHMRTRPFGESLGVVALSRAQADLIDQLVNERRILQRDVDERFDESADEPFFVKNLESVQGDERDHMILSIGYGPTVGSGAVPNRFGPINSDGGERRLNVAITRAKRRVDVVHSLRASDIHSQQVGARFLRRYLEYAADPQRAFEAEVTVDSTAEPESPFEAAVEQALLSRGYRVERQVGVSGYRIDLAILSEDGTSRDLGIECDGWTYHSAPAARDRDWLRQKVLEGLGWKIHRVWSTAWIRNPEAELSRIEDALLAARSRQSASAVNSPKNPTTPAATNEPPGPPELEVVSSSIPEVVLERYIPADIPRRPNWAVLGSETTQNLIETITQIAEAEGPVHEDVVIDRLREAYGVGRVRGSTRSHVEHSIHTAIREGRVKSTEQFIWCREPQLSRLPRSPVDGNIEHYPPSELKTIVLGTAKLMFAAPRRDLVIESRRTLGFSRTGGRITEVIEGVIQSLLDEGELSESFGNIHPT